MSFALIAALFAALYVSNAIVARAPLAVSRFARVPVGEPIALRLPPAIAPVVLPVTEHAADYRAPAERRLALGALPGDASVVRGDYVLRFVPEANCILARSKGRWSDATLVRVDATATADLLTLRARRFPAEVPPVLLGLFVVGWSFVSAPHAVGRLGFLLALAAMEVVVEWRRSTGCVDAVVEEMKARLAAASGEPLEPELQTAAEALRAKPRVNEKGEWLCACDMANAPKRTTCRRCWAQRPPLPSASSNASAIAADVALAPPSSRRSQRAP